MKSLWVFGGAIVGRKAFGLPGAVLGGGLGYGLAAILDILRRLEAVERSTEAVSVGHAAERYPEETILDAMLQVEDEEASRGDEMEDIFVEVSGKKKRLH
jgi:hypothetical protein